MIKLKHIVDRFAFGFLTKTNKLKNWNNSTTAV